MRTILNSIGALSAVVTLTACGGGTGDAERNDANSAAGNSLTSSQPARPPGSLTDWIADMREKVKLVPDLFAADAPASQRAVMDVYINQQEYVEIYYGEAGRVSKGGALGVAVVEAESMFHNLMMLTGESPKASTARVRALADSLDVQLAAVARIALELKVPLTPPDTLDGNAASDSGTAVNMDAIIALVGRARALNADGERDAARRTVEQAYLEEFEPLEPLLPMATVARVEELVHMRLRPRLAGEGSKGEIDSLFAVLSTELKSADEALRGERSAWFGALSSFFIVVREGLEAVLLVAAMVAYLSRSTDMRSQRTHVYAGAAFGVFVSLLTWLAARTLIPMSGGSRELMEGITALIAVAVLLYVSHWIFRRTYMGQWKNFLNSRVQKAVGAGSGLTLAGLSFAAVYREGFETVLFYEALLVDQPGAAVALGFGAGAAVIAAVGFAIIYAGLRLPLRLVFRATNAVLLFLSVAILGKGLYNLQEAGLFSPHPLTWLPNSEFLRQVLGFYPLAETLLAQLALVTLVVVMYVIYRLRGELSSQPVRSQ